MTQSLQYIEIDVDHCSLSYAVAPCQAKLDIGTTLFSNANPALTTQVFCTQTSGADVTTPRGDTRDAYLITEDTTNNYHDSEQTFAKAAAQTSYVFEGYVKSKGRYVEIGILDSVGIMGAYAIFDLNSGDTLEATAWGVSSPAEWEYIDSAIESVADGWWYFKLITRSNTSTTITFYIQPSKFDTSIPYAGDGVSGIYYWRLRAGLYTATTDSPPSTGIIKCFNTLATCQDRANFTNDPVTIRFAIPTAYLPSEIECVPSLKSIDFTPATISLGQNLGERASLTLTFTDHRDSDTAAWGDKYYAERPYDPFRQGTFFGKFRARQPFLFGRALRWINGTVGQGLDEMETRHFIIDSFSGPSQNGEYQIVAKDVLKLADGDKAVAPSPSTGFLVADINDVTTAATLSPSGVGDDEYPASGYVAIGGEEICSFTRSGDALTLTRAQLNTTASDHKAQDRVQLVLRYTSQSPDIIIADLLTTYASVPSSYIDTSLWAQEIAAYLNRVYTAVIAQPTSVNALVSELIEQAGLSMWWDDRNQTIGLRVLRGIFSNTQGLSDENIVGDSLEITEQPDKRISQVQTYFGQINALTSLTDKANFRSSAILIDTQSEDDYQVAAIKEIYSRWIPELGRSIASRINEIIIGRFKNPPRHFKFSLIRDSTDEIILASGYDLTAWPLQDATGAREAAQIQVTRLQPNADLIVIEGDEVLFSAPDEDLSNRILIIDSNINNVNLRTAHDSLYPPAASGDTVTIYVNAGVIVGSASTSQAAITVGDWASGVTLNMFVSGRIQGAGGKGDGFPSTGGQAGGTALYTRIPISIDSTGGEVWGGGGGGGLSNGFVGAGPTKFSNSGGGGAGTVPGAAGIPYALDIQNTANPGTADAGGTAPFSPTGGNGGDPGQAGQNSTGGLFINTNGGAAGAAIDGDSFVTHVADGDLRGSLIN